ncbi:uncharacterized protein TrAtP1_010010 [Trichoderma atroviride]|uniref:uncharacterized protein n=1 Tax=Hypocrea atroviridis TaxID=63577 RepID=UPI003320DAD4|nr:hypothetical protein TrAtP1_010010 [Trichoderma atroviride]
MASVLANVIGKRILRENVKNKFGKEDPYFEQVPATRLDGRPTGKFKKRKKALPPGISEHDGQVLTKVKRRAYRLDMSLFNFMGIRFGWSSVIGLIPAAGDALDAFMALMVYRTCCQVEGGLPTSVRLQMLINIVLDFAVGLVPFLGDLVDAVFRANTRNAALLEEHLRQKGKTELRKSGLPVPAVDPSSAQEYDRIQREDPPRVSIEPPRPAESLQRGTMTGITTSRELQPPRQFAMAAVIWAATRLPPHDVEMGEVDSGQHHQGSSSHGGKKKSKWHGLL